MGMFDGFWLRHRAVVPQHRGTATPRADGDAKEGDSFDEFGAPEGGFGRLDMLLNDLKVVASQQVQAPAEPGFVADYALAAPPRVAS